MQACVFKKFHNFIKLIKLMKPDANKNADMNYYSNFRI